MNFIYLIKRIVLKRPGFQSQKYGMPNYIHDCFQSKKPVFW